MRRQARIPVVETDNTKPLLHKDPAERFRPADPLGTKPGDQKDCVVVVVAEAVIADDDAVGFQ